MGGSAPPADAPVPADFESVFDVYEVRTAGDTVLYVGEPLVATGDVERRVWSVFEDADYEVSLQQGYGAEGLTISRAEHVLIAEPAPDEAPRAGLPWRNLLLFGLTVVSTLYAGAAFWYHISVLDEPLRVLEAWPFSVAIMGVFGIHELGHYVMSRYHGVRASLPYFIPQPLIVGTFGAVINMKGRLPNRQALFDIGVAGPLAGLLASIVVAVIGLHLDPLPAEQAAAAASEGAAIRFHNPPLMQVIAAATGATERLGPNATVHPVFFAAWIGMLMTFLNMIPVGQLDGGHVVRALVGKRQETVAAAVPGALFALAGYLLFVRNDVDSVMIWVLWGIIAIAMTAVGPASPVSDEPIDRKRIAVGLLTIVLAALCFTPVPIEIVQ